jgi:hypothetical protein
MMTFSTRDLATLNAAILGDMVEVAELNNPQLCLRSEHDEGGWVLNDQRQLLD